MKLREHRGRKVLAGVGIFVVVAVLAFFGIQFFTKTGIFRIPGVVYYDESLSETELEQLHGIFTEEVDLDKDVYISATNYFEKPSVTSGEFLVKVSVPVTDFYSLDTSIVASEPDLLFADAYQSDVAFTMIDINDLNFSRRLLAINDHYYLDEFDKGAVFRVLKFESEKYDEEIAPLIGDSFVQVFPEKESVLTFAQTGVTALSRGMNRKLYSVGDANYFAEGIGPFLSGFDLTHTSNESSFTDYATSDNICSDPRFMDTLKAIGLDIVELTGNHNVDCGATSALETIDTYTENGILMVGGGKNADEAAKPLQLDKKGSDITFLAYNLSTGGATHGSGPGANQYYEENAIAEINAAKQRGDFVIVDIQYYECNAYASTYEDPICDYPQNVPGDEIGFFRHLIDLGADMVVGTSAHQPQTFELYGDGVIYYGLGNLFFDQSWWPGTTRSLVLAHYFYKDKLLQTKIVPTVYDGALQTKLMDEETKKWFLSRLISARP
ncbi:MAG: CapA family protein [Candidatus Saccharibacteria bacterium]|nr:CapA family protein [Candidatus Saccharibacteria bacterium]